jgi:hypothetical protein
MISKDELEEVMVVGGYALVGGLIACVSFLLPTHPLGQFFTGLFFCIAFGLSTIDSNK